MSGKKKERSEGAGAKKHKDKEKSKKYRRTDEESQASQEKVSHLAWKIRRRASICGTKEVG